MNNIVSRIPAAVLKELIEKHLNENLAQSRRAKVSAITSQFDPAPETNQPAMGLSVTFDVIEV